MITVSAMEFNVALQTASYSEADASSVRGFKRDGQHISYGSFQAVGDDGIEIKLVPAEARDHRHKQIAGLINYFADLFGVILYVELDDTDEVGKSDISFLETNGFMQGRRFDEGTIPLCRQPRTFMSV
jgi:hypothetical protein